MPLETGGRADKFGNRYEHNCIIYELLKVIREDNYSVTIEALGDDEKGTDILVKKSDGKIEHQQCKARNASKETWSLYDLQSKDIIKNWEYQLNRDADRCVTMVSHIPCTYLVDLHSRATNTNDKLDQFYDVQIQGSDSKFVNFYKNLCKNLGLNIDDKSGVIKSVEYLRRISFKQMSEYSLQENINNMIDFYFSTDKNTTYNALVTYIVEGDILGKEITCSVLSEYLESQDISFRLMDGDTRIISQITKLNREYRSSYRPLKGNLIERTEFEKCIDIIQNEGNLIISGKAGYGKSGCVEAVLDYCEENEIPHIALKLDKDIPHGSSNTWGKELGFPGSITYALDSISKEQNAVLLMDQLDALRWTLSNSGEAICVCMEIIKQINYLNKHRKRKISIALVCRSYDLENDKNIKSLFSKEEYDELDCPKWETVVVNKLDESIVKNIVGEKYNSLTAKTRELLQIPSNLYIWNHLDETETYDDCTTSNHLIEKWFDQMCKRGVEQGITEQLLINVKDEIVEKMDKTGRLFVPKTILSYGETGLTHLMSAEMITSDGNKIRFVHQSILDYFISKRMIKQYWEGVDIEHIIGEKSRQTPGKRYQVQMFMQDLLESEVTDFIEVGKQLIESNDIRYYVKFVFYEMLRQIDTLHEEVETFIAEYCKKETYKTYLINNVFYGNKAYITLLRKNGVLVEWMSDDEMKGTVFSLFASISEKLDDEDVTFIESYAFKNKDDDISISRCFMNDISRDSDALFELRLKFYKRYPEWSLQLYLDVKRCFAVCYKRIVELIAFWLSEESGSNKKNVYRYDELLDNNKTFHLENPEYILDKLLPLISKDDQWGAYYSGWRTKYNSGNSLERFVVKLVKKATELVIKKNKTCFWQYYEPYMGMNYAVFNELILHGLKCLPESESNRVITYLNKDIYSNSIDYTSNAKNQFDMAREVIAIHSKYCDSELVTSLEAAISGYISPDAVERYKRRIEFNRERVGIPVYWSFWGDFQYLMLQSICYERISDRSKDLLNVLKRRFVGKPNHYDDMDGHFGTVISPVTKKDIGAKQWLQILTNKKLKNRKHSNYREVSGGFVESSIEMYAGDFQSEVKRNPKTMIRMVLDNRNDILPVYIESLFSGAAFSEEIDEVDKELWEELFKAFPCDSEKREAYYFCSILEKVKSYDWSPFVIEQLINIATNYQEKELELNQQNNSLINGALNSTRGEAARAIGHILWTNENALPIFIDTIDKMCSDSSPAIRFASLFALWPAYHIDRVWASERIMSLYETDVRMLSFQGSKDMLIMLYEEYKDRIIPIILHGFNAADERVIEVSGCSICELNILYSEFMDKMSNLNRMSKEQLKSILQMAVIYLGIEEYRAYAKQLVLKVKNTDEDLEFPLSRIFFDKLVDAERDLEFLVELMRSKVSRRVVYAFVHYLEESVTSYKSYAEVIINLCENVLSAEAKQISREWHIDDLISKLIIYLYDECAGSNSPADKKITDKCLDLWDIMFEKQIGQTRWLSKELMER